MGRGGIMEGGLVTVAAKSRAQGMGVGKREDRSEGGGDGESTAIREDGCTVGIKSRVLGLEAQTDPMGRAGGCEGAGMDA